MFDYIPTQIEYQEGLIVYYQRNYDNPDSVCASVASQRNTAVLANPGWHPALQFLRLNPRATNHPSYGLGCTFDFLQLVDYLPSLHAGDVSLDQYQQGAIQTVQKCPSGYSMGTVIGPPNYSYCYLASVLTPECTTGNCPAAGKPAIISAGIEILSETDHPRRGSSPLEFTRHYRSSPSTTASWQTKQDRLGYLWGDTYRRSVKLVPGSVQHQVQTIVMVTRPTGHLVMFSGSPGAWVAEADVGDRLTQQLDGSGNTLGWQYKNAVDDSVESFDAAGRLLTITSRSGVTQTLTYSTSATSTSIAPGAGFLIGVADNFGNSLAFTYDAQLRIATVTEPGVGTTIYGYDSSSNLAQVTHADGTTRGYLYNEQAHTQNTARPFSLTGITDENNSRYATIKYDSSGRVESTQLGTGIDLTSFSYAAGGASTTVTDVLGASRTYSFSKVFNRAKSTGVSRTCSGCTSASSPQSLDANGNVSSKTDFNGNVTNFGYDLSRNLETTRTEAFGTPRARTITTAWHATFRIPTSITEPNRTTTFTHDPAGNVLTRTVTDTSVTPNVSRTWTYTYNGFGQVLTEDGPRTDVTDVTTYSYYTCTTGYQCGQLATISNTLSHVTTFNTYNAHGQPTQITDANGLVTSLAYDARHRLTDRCTGATLPSCFGGELTHLDYWPTGLLKKVTNADASYIEYTYDAAHRLTEIKDGAFNKIVYTLDNAGNRTAENTYDPSFMLKRTHTRVFNTLNQLWKDVNAAGTANVTTVFGYDNNGNQTSTAAPLSRNSSSLYDELNRLKQITDPASGNTLFGYDANDNLASVTDPRSLVTSYTYTGFGDLKTQTSPDTGLTTNTYDSGGNLKTSTDARNAITTYTYDALNRVKTAAFKIGSTTDQTITYAYDAGTNGKGRLTSASDANHQLAWAYDAQGRVTGKGQSWTGVTPVLSIGYGYNAQGQLFHLVLPSGKAITYGYNSNGQVNSVSLDGSPSTTILNNITYDPFGPITGWTWGNGTASASRTFDTDGKLTAISSTASVVGNRTFGYDDAFRITGTTDSLSSSLNWTLGYDLLDRLNSASKTGTTIGYTYDTNGNRLTQTGTSASTYTVSGTSNKLSSTTGGLVRTYTYNNSGSVLTSGVATHTYYNSGRMKTGKLGSAGATTYIYNALGQRIKKSGGAVSPAVYFMYDEAGHLVGEYTISGTTVTPVQETVWLGDIPVATIRGTLAAPTIFYVHTDQLDTPRKVTNTANQVRWKWDPSPFGDGGGLNENPASLGTFKYHLRFPGQYFDLEANLNYNYFRDYDPASGRYAQSDPIGLNGGINTYLYAEASPSQYADPFGLTAIPWISPRIAPIVRPGAGIRPYPIVDPAFPIVMPSEESVADCEAACDRQWDKDIAWCEIVWKMKGRPKGGYTTCKREANKNYILCYQNCKRYEAGCPISPTISPALLAGLE